MKRKPTTVQMPEDLYRRIKATSQTDGESLSQIVCQAVERELDRRMLMAMGADGLTGGMGTDDQQRWTQAGTSVWTNHLNA